MKVFRLIAFSFVLASIFAVSAFAQAQPQMKIGLVNTEVFYADQGIKKISNAYTSLEAEFKPSYTELETGAKRLQALQTELQTLQEKANNPKIPIDQKAASAKAEQYETLKKDLTRKQEDFKARYAKREAEVLSPIVQDIGTQLGEYAKQKGYTMIMDSSKLYQAQVLIYAQDATDITKEFVQFYNARPGGTATK